MEKNTGKIFKIFFKKMLTFYNHRVKIIIVAKRNR